MMTNRFNILLLVSCFLNLSCASSRIPLNDDTVLPATSLQPFGRFSMNDQELELIGSAVHFGFSFEGDECQLFASLSGNNGHNYLQYELDGVYQKRIRIEGNAPAPIVFV